MPCPNHLTHDPMCFPCGEAVREEQARALAFVSTGADVLASGTTRPGYQHSEATWVEGREAPRGGGFTPRALQLDRAAAAMPDIEACARAAYEAEHNGQPRYLWETPESSDYAMRPEVKERFRRIARAVLAAAGVGR